MPGMMHPFIIANRGAMAAIAQANVQEFLEELSISWFQGHLMPSNAICHWHLLENLLKVGLRLPFPLGDRKQAFIQALTDKIHQVCPHLKVSIELEFQIKAHQTQKDQKAHPQIKNVIGVASGKGGVGKSTTAIHLALALNHLGARVGLLDADIYGPSQPLMLGAGRQKATVARKKFEPVVRHGLQTMSIGYLVDENTPMVWRGPMVSGALQQLFWDTQWKPLDYLIIDLPPGTGDVQLTLAQKIPLTGAVMVTTPQPIAVLDVQKALTMFQKVSIHVLGLVENMSHHVCPSCHHTSAIFGEGGGQALAKRFNVPFLGQVPFDPRLRELGDQGRSLLVEQLDGTIAQTYQKMAIHLAACVGHRPICARAPFSNIVLEPTETA